MNNGMEPHKAKPGMNDLIGIHVQAAVLRKVDAATTTAFPKPDQKLVMTMTRTIVHEPKLPACWRSNSSGILPSKCDKRPSQGSGDEARRTFRPITRPSACYMYISRQIAPKNLTNYRANSGYTCQYMRAYTAGLDAAALSWLAFRI
jgi:hypothetical protein